ncbi:MAG: hypothetical protein DRN12_05455 [Thermoplasmata archaeon]|nr:MAG: hypothetical protein DRN12_05455 [Thermoplasmata archaeon]
MNKKIIGIIILLYVSIFLAIPAIASEVTMDFYYSSNCGECEEKLHLIETYFINNESYKSILKINLKDVITNDTAFQEWKNIYDFYPYPFVVIKNDSISTEPIGQFNITVSNLNNIINQFLSGEYHPPTYNSNDNEDHKKNNIIYTPLGRIDVSELSLPILTIVLAGIDSFNPCAFFILIFLLNMLIYARSRKQMLLIGSIFIFFSGLLYMLFMFVMYEALIRIQSKENMMLLTIAVGCIVLPMGLLNIKDFFFFKKGVSLSIPDDKKPEIYKKMRQLVKKQSLTAIIIGTIILAGTVNFYELLCTLGLPFTFTNVLSQRSIEAGSASYYMYILFYNIVYVIPLIIIVLIFVITLGRRKLSEWHGRIMKLLSGILLASFGIIFLYNYKILENPVTPIILLFGSLLATWIISYIWRETKEKQNKTTSIGYK